MTAEERQRRGDRYAREWFRWCAVETDASLERAEAFARSCAEWATRHLPEDCGAVIGVDVGADSRGAAVLGRHRPDGRLEIVAEHVFSERQLSGARAALDELRAQQAPPPAPVASRPEIGAPGVIYSDGAPPLPAVQAAVREALRTGGPPTAPVASRATYGKGDYARDSGDPGAREGYQPEWAVPLGRKP